MSQMSFLETPSESAPTGLRYPVTEREADMEGLYRYSLRIGWRGGLGALLFCMLNPSTADALADDRTSHRCIDFAQQWGFASLEIVNLFALISTESAVLRTAPAPVGPRNDAAILRALARTQRAVVAWGGAIIFRPRMNPLLRGRDQAVLQLIAAQGRAVECMGLTEEGQPRHPLMLKKTTILSPFGD